MPLVSGSSKAAISENIKRLSHENANRAKPRPLKQRIAIAYAVARRSKKK